MSDATSEKVTHSRRRGFLLSGLVALAGGLFGKKALAAEEQGELVTEGQVLKTHVMKGKPPFEPLDTMVLFERSDNSNGPASSHEIISLEHEEKGNVSYPWTVYSHLTTHHTEGDAVVYYARLHKKGPGWSTGFHSEVFSSARAVGLGMNIEMYNNHPIDTQMIGLNVQAHGPYDSQYGIQVHDTDGHFERGIGLNGKGKVGLDLGGEFETGIDTHSNDIRLNEGACVILDGRGDVRVRYQGGRIEFLNGERCVAHISVHGRDHEL